MKNLQRSRRERRSRDIFTLASVAPLALKKTMLTPSQPNQINGIFDEIRQLITDARQHVAVAVNAGLTMLYWQIGNRIRREILRCERAEYGAEIVTTLAKQLEAEFGRGFSVKSLRHMIRFAEAYPDETIVSALLRQLTWTHFLPLIYIEDPLKRDFYAEMCRIERRANEEQPIGLILCAGKKHETIELLDLEKSGIKVSAYWTDALPKEQLEQKLHDAVRLARLRLEQRDEP